MINPFSKAREMYLAYKDNQEGKHSIVLPDWEELEANEKLQWIETAFDEYDSTH